MDQQKIERAYQYRTRIYRQLKRLVGNAEAAADLTQETYIRAMNNSGHASQEEIAYPWLARIARNLAIDFFRHNGCVFLLSLDASIHEELENKMRTWTELLLDQQEKHDPEYIILAREKLAEVCQYLPPDDLAIFQLLNMGYSHCEIASIVGAPSDSALKMRIYRVRRAMRQLVTTMGEVAI